MTKTAEESVKKAEKVDNKKKEKVEEEEISEEDLQLKTELEMLVQRLKVEKRGIEIILNLDFIILISITFWPFFSH